MYEILYSMCIIMSCKKIVAFLVSVSNASTHVSLKNCIFFHYFINIFRIFIKKKKKAFVRSCTDLFIIFILTYWVFFFINILIKRCTIKPHSEARKLDSTER